MPAISATVIAAVGLAVAGTGAIMTYQGQQKQAKAQEAAIGEQQRAEALRQKQMNLDAMRRKREIIRQSLAARAQTLAATTAMGAAGSGGSALPGSYGSLSGRTNVNQLGVNQNQEIGNSIFGAHQGVLAAYRQSAAAGAGIALGQGLSTLGGAMMKNNDTIARIGTSFLGTLKGA